MARRAQSIRGALAAACLLLGVGCATSGGADVDAREQEARSGPGDAAEPLAPGEPSDEPEIPALLPAIDDLDETVVTITTAAGAAHVDAKVATTSEEHRQGLMGVPALPDGVGMLFIFEEDRTGGFWMRDTLVPLDIAYADADGVIQEIRAMEPCQAAGPGDCQVYAPAQSYRVALEVAQGWFAGHGVAEGDLLSWAEPVAAG